MHNAVNRGDFKGFKINEEENVSLMQFSRKIMADGCCENMLTTKAILRGFKMMSGLKINFHQSEDLRYSCGRLSNLYFSVLKY